MGAMVNQTDSGGRDLGVVITPVYCQKHAGLYKVEEAANQRLASANVCQDPRFTIPYQGKNDQREQRTDAVSQISFFICTPLYITFHNCI